MRCRGRKFIAKDSVRNIVDGIKNHNAAKFEPYKTMDIKKVQQRDAEDITLDNGWFYTISHSRYVTNSKVFK